MRAEIQNFRLCFSPVKMLRSRRSSSVTFGDTFPPGEGIFVGCADTTTMHYALCTMHYALCTINSQLTTHN